MTLNYRGSKYEVNATNAKAVVAPRRGVYRGAAVDFAQVQGNISSGRPLTYRGSAYTAK